MRVPLLRRAPPPQRPEPSSYLLGGASELSLVVRRGKALDHLVTLTALRVLLEVQTDRHLERFVASLQGPHVAANARPPRLTHRDPLDDYTGCPPGAACEYVCLGCHAPRLLLQNLKCGKCGTHATLAVEEYTAAPRTRLPSQGIPCSVHH